MSEAGQGTGNTSTSAQIDAFCDIVRRALLSVSDAVTPSEPARHHFRESRIEFLRGVRSIIDHRIDTLSRRNQSGARVTVE